MRRHARKTVAMALLIMTTLMMTCRLSITILPKPFPVGTQSSYEFKQAAPWVATNGVNAIGYADFNGDGIYDYVMGSLSGSTGTVPIAMLFGDSDGSFAHSTSLLPKPVPGVVHARKVVVADFNGDHVADFLIADHGYDQPPFPGASPLLMMSSGGRFIQIVIPGVPVGFQHGASAADVTGTGKLDIIVLDATNGAFYLSNDGSGNFSVTRANLPASVAAPAEYYTAELIDVDGDGYYDLIVGGHEQSGMVTRVFWGDSSHTFSDARRSDIPGDADYQIVLDAVAEDTNGDGIKELVLNRTKANPFYEGYYFQILTQSGRLFTDVSTRIVPSKAAWAGSTAQWVDWIQLVDVNGDGFRDIRVMDRARNLVYLNNGNGNFTRFP